MGKTALFLGGGAPNLTLMSGALLALHEAKVGFDIVATAGAGAVVGLVYLAPSGFARNDTQAPKKALMNMVNFGVSDAIYKMFPVNYKVFGKSGPSAEAFNDYWFSIPAVRDATNQLDMSDQEKLWADWLLFLGAMMCPTDLTFFSQGMCAHPRLIENLVAFPVNKVRLRGRPIEVQINAFNIDKHKITHFSNRPRRGRVPDITADHLRAALSFPFIYSPYTIRGERFYEGAAFQTLNSTDEIAEIDRFIVLNPLVPNLIQAPRNLWDAYIQSIIMPVVGLAESEVHPPFPSGKGDAAQFPSWQYYRTPLHQLMQTIHMADPSRARDREKARELLAQLNRKEWYSANFVIEERYVHDSLNWGRSSLKRLFDLGRERGEQLAADIKSRNSHYDLAHLAGQVSRLHDGRGRPRRGRRS